MIGNSSAAYKNCGFYALFAVSSTYALEELDHIAVRSGHVYLISCTEHEIAVRDSELITALYCADEHVQSHTP